MSAVPAPRLRFARRGLAGSLGSALALVTAGALSLGSPLVQRIDVAVARKFLEFRHGSVGEVALTVVHVCDREPYAVVGLSLVAIALMRRRWMLACVLPVILLGSVATTEVLKPLLATQRSVDLLDPPVSAASWPSGHATAALTLALCAVLVAPASVRRTVALLGTLFVCTLAWATLVFGGHLPSDLVGGYLVVALWGLLAVPWLQWCGADRSTAVDGGRPQGADGERFIA